MSDCLFCQIVAGEVPAEIVHESETTIAFRDINPQAPTHILVIPREHISTVNDLTDEQLPLLGEMVAAAKEIAMLEGIADEGYRLVMNCNRGAGQTVFHIHLHILGGRGMTWPPG